MNLATRCPACGTVFRVVHDQLRVSEGWVRCGRCDEVFSALKSLFDLDRGTPPPLTEAPRAEAGPEAPAEPEHDATHATTVIGREEPALPLPLVRSDDEPDAVPMPMPAPLATRRPGDPAQVDRPLHVEPAGAPAVVARKTDAPSEPTLIGARRPAAEDAYAAPDEGDGDESPAFVVHAQRRARWRRSTTRPVLISAALLLAIALAGQALFEFRSPLIEHWPALRASAERLCAALGCTLPSPMHLAQLTVDSAALSRANAAGVNRLAVTIRNRGNRPVAAPALELSLSDEQGQVIVRRVFLPGEYGTPRPTIAPRADLPIQLPLAIDEPRLSGFSVEIFYP